MKQIQINNLRIRYDKGWEKYKVIAPDGRILEEFDYLKDAKKCAKSITDFVR